MTYVDINPASAVARHARRAPDSVAAVYAGGDLTYADLDDRAARLARVLADRGVAAGDRVAFLGLNSASFIVTMLAALRMGALYVPINFRLAPPELRAVLDASGACVLVAEEGHRPIADSLEPRPAALRHLLLVDDDPEVPAPSSAPGWELWRGPTDAAAPVERIVPGAMDDPAILMFTSGTTTGVPKGVILTFGNIWWNSINVESAVDSRIGDATHVAAPMFHIGALNSFAIRSLVRGNRMVIRRTFDAVETLRDYETHQIATTFVVPAMCQAMQRVDDFLTRDLSGLRSVIVAGAPVPPSLIRDWADRGVMLQQAWGLTETAPFATHLPADQTLIRTGSAGVAMPYTQVKVVDPVTGDDTMAGASGEILVRGPNVTPGYWANPEATAAAFDGDGWFHTGDIGHLDDDGYLFIVDRLKDMVISGGENVYPAEVERALADLPGLADVAVVGAHDERWGEIVVAVVSVVDGVDLTLDDVRAHAAASLARYKLPHRLEIVDVVPRNASGKLDKVAIRRRLGQARV